MCIIIAGKVKDLREELIKETALEKELKIQGDGWGIFIPPRTIYKTLDYNKFKKYFKKNIYEINEEIYIVVHGRNATSGDIALYNTHPILFYSKEDIIKDKEIDEIELEVSNKELLLFHNGVIHSFNNLLPKTIHINLKKKLIETKEYKEKYNDTKLFVEKIKNLKYEKILEEIQKEARFNKFALIKIKEQTITLFGEFYEYKNKIYTSVYISEIETNLRPYYCDYYEDKRNKIFWDELFKKSF